MTAKIFESFDATLPHDVHECPAEIVDPFPFVAGQVVTSPSLTTGGRVEITAVGRYGFLGLVYGCRDWVQDGVERPFDFEIDTSDGGPWALVPEPVVHPERWINVYPLGASMAYRDRIEADRNASRDTARLGVIHLCPDGTLEMEEP